MPEPLLVMILSFIVNGLLGMAMYFMKEANKTVKEDIVELRTKIDMVKDSYIKKEDFQEFKREIFAYMEKIERRLEEALKDK